MRTIHFKSGNEILVNQDIVNIIRDRIIEGSKQFQTFSNDNGDCFLIINVTEIDYIE